MNLNTPVAPPANSAEPGTVAPVAEKAKRVAKPRPKLIKHPALTAEDGSPVLLTVRPTDFNTALHQPLKKANFVSETAFLEDYITAQELKIANARKQIEILKTTGSSAVGAQAKALLKMRAKMAELEALLKAGGYDLSTLESPE